MSFENETWQLCLVLDLSCHHVYFSPLLNSCLYMMAFSVHWMSLSEFYSNVELLTFIHIHKGYEWRQNSINCVCFEFPFPPLLSGAYLVVKLLWACSCLVAKCMHIYDRLQGSEAATSSGHRFWGQNISNLVAQPGRWCTSFQRNQWLQHLIRLMESHYT